jgi:Icc-related predicted phosphoesterase
MKILHTTDLHFNKIWFDWIKSQEDEFDIFCISGDFLESSKDETLLEQITWISNWICKFNKPLFVCSGNHDIEELDNEDWLNKIDTSNFYADNTIKTIENIQFGCYPYIGADGYYEFDKCDVLITHVPPTNTKTSIDKDGNDWGDKALYNAIKNKIISPKIILCGHLHRPISTLDKINSTVIYNAGVNKKNETPCHHILEIQ